MNELAFLGLGSNVSPERHITIAIERLGAAFDITGFHDVVLGSGPVPLPLLAERVGAWQSDAAA